MPSVLEKRCVDLFKNIDSLDSIHGISIPEMMAVQLYLVFIIAHPAAETPMVHGVQKLRESFPDISFKVQQLDYAHQDRIPKEAICLWYRPEKDRKFKPN
jgi:hypothetical protein